MSLFLFLFLFLFLSVSNPHLTSLQAVGPLHDGRVCVVFRDGDQVTDVLVVDPGVDSGSEGSDMVRRIAQKYLRKGFGLFTAEGRNMTANTCFRDVVADGSYTIHVSRRFAVEAHQLPQVRKRSR